MNEPEQCGTLPISALPMLLDFNRSLFDVFTLRQDSLGAHKDTRSIMIRGILGDQQTWQSMPFAETILPIEDEELVASSLYICRELMHQQNGYRLGGVLLVELKGGGEILPHIDQGIRAEYYDRYHIMLHGEQTWFTGEAKTPTTMKAGEVWKVPNRLLHSVKNNNKSIPRLCLIVDIRLS